VQGEYFEFTLFVALVDRMKQNQIIFASVHDSYWTHASTVEPMSELIRATFVDLHSQPIMAQLREEVGLLVL